MADARRARGPAVSWLTLAYEGKCGSAPARWRTRQAGPGRSPATSLDGCWESGARSGVAAVSAGAAADRRCSPVDGPLVGAAR